MKKFIALTLLGFALCVTLMAAAPDYHSFQSTIDTMTIDSQHTASVWEVVDTIIVIKTDTCHTLYTISGIAQLDPSDKLYVGIDDGGGKEGAPLDTLILSGLGARAGQVWMPFSLSYADSLISQTDANDTIYVYMAVGGSSSGERVFVKNLIFTAQILDRSAAEIIGE